MLLAFCFLNVITNGFPISEYHISILSFRCVIQSTSNILQFSISKSKHGVDCLSKPIMKAYMEAKE